MLLERLNVDSFAELYGMDVETVLRKLDAGPELPLQDGDAFLSVLNLRAIADLQAATAELDASTRSLSRLTWALVFLTAVTVLVAGASLVVALNA